MKKEYKTPELKKIEFSVIDDILTNSLEGEKGGDFGGDGNNTSDNLSAKTPFEINGSGFGW